MFKYVIKITASITATFLGVKALGTIAQCHKQKCDAEVQMATKKGNSENKNAAKKTSKTNKKTKKNNE